jgi:hypothetical protein
MRVPDVDVADRVVVDVVVAPPPTEAEAAPAVRRVRRRTVLASAAVALLATGAVTAAVFDEDEHAGVTAEVTTQADAVTPTPTDAPAAPPQVAAAIEQAPPVTTSAPAVGESTVVPVPVAPREGSVVADRTDPVTVWTGREVLVWGGVVEASAARTTYAVDGAAFDPTTGTWRTLAPAPLSPDRYAGVWTGTELVVIGGGEATVDGAAYDPVTDTWRDIAYPPLALVESRLTFRDGVVYVSGAVRTGEAVTGRAGTMAYDVATDRWTEDAG